MIFWRIGLIFKGSNKPSGCRVIFDDLPCQAWRILTARHRVKRLQELQSVCARREQENWWMLHNSGTSRHDCRGFLGGFFGASSRNKRM